MNTKKHKNTPLFTALVDYTQKGIIPFDVPGHKKGNVENEFNSVLGEMTMKMDVNSSKELDMLGNPSGVIMEAEKLMAEAYDADHAFLLVNGSTSGVQYMIMSACGPKDKIIIPRNVHKSAINGLILSGAMPIFVQPEIDTELGIANGVSVENIKKAIKENPDAKAVFLINPTYFGSVSNLKGIIKLAHKHKMAVLVDEAHGAHFPFHRDLPLNAMQLGADLATASMHKTAGSLTQSSILLLNENLIPKHQVRSTINLMQTTSASYLLMSSLDVARKKLVLEGEKIFTSLLNIIREVKEEINKVPGLKAITSDYIDGVGVCDYDDTKLVVQVNDLGLSGFEVYDILREEYHIQVELAETYVILAVISVGDNRQSIEKLVTALKDISKKFYGKKPKLEVETLASLGKPKMLISPREAYYSKKKLLNIKEAEGEISGESIMIYPPGIPLVIPGEKISKEIIDYYDFLKTQNSVTINDEENSDLIKVLGE